MEFFSQKENEVASFYAGLVFSTFHLDVKQELQDCMVRDQDLVDLWNKGISSLSVGETDEWHSQIDILFERIDNDFEGCTESAVLRTVALQFDNWWGTFWSDSEKAWEQIDEHAAENWLALKKQSIALRFNWEIGSFYDAGVRLGNFWSIEIGTPQWVDHLSSETEQQEESYPLAIFYGAYFEELYQDNQTDQLLECFVPDDLHMGAHDLFFISLDPYDHFAYQKYFAVIRVLSDFNLDACLQVPEIQALITQDQDKWNSFWGKENAMAISHINSQKYQTQLDSAVTQIQKSWNMADAASAGKAYAQYQRMLTEQPTTTE